MSFVVAARPARADEAVDLARRKHLVERFPFGRLLDADVGRQVNLHFFWATGRIHSPANPDDVGRLDAVLVF